MDFLDDETLLSRLPRRQDDEPPNLRQDLLDEVRDYLQSAWEEEQRRTPDCQEAWRIVLKRFGDPAKLVRKLWFDALKEQIMSRRLVLAAFGVLIVFLAILTGLTWQTSAALQASVNGTREANLLLAEKLQTLGEELKALKSAPDLTWGRLRLQLKSEDGSAVRGIVKILGMPFGIGGVQQSDSLEFSVGPDGQVDSGLIHVGSYDVVVHLENGYRTILSRVVLQPGHDFETALVCPAVHKPHETHVRLEYKRPPLAKATGDIWLLARLEEVGREVDGTLWQDPAQTRWGRTLLVEPTGKTWTVDPSGQSVGEECSAGWRITQKQVGVGAHVAIENLDQQSWDGIVPAGVTCRVVSTELMILQDHMPGSSTWKFRLCWPDQSSAAFDDAPDSQSRRSVQLHSMPADQEPYCWNVPVDAEAVDGRLGSLEYLTTEEFEMIYKEQQVMQPGGMGGGFF